MAESQILIDSPDPLPVVATRFPPELGQCRRRNPFNVIGRFRTDTPYRPSGLVDVAFRVESPRDHTPACYTHAGAGTRPQLAASNSSSLPDEARPRV
jgi:hypothetical protein